MTVPLAQDVLRVWHDKDGRLVGARVGHARTAAARARGLLGRRFLADGEGILIEPCNGVHALGMRMAIDAAYLDKEGVVVAVLAPLRPWRLGPVVRRARYVLEVGEGVLARTGVCVGDRLCWATAVPE